MGASATQACPSPRRVHGRMRESLPSKRPHQLIVGWHRSECSSTLSLVSKRMSDLSEILSILTYKTYRRWLDSVNGYWYNCERTAPGLCVQFFFSCDQVLSFDMKRVFTSALANRFGVCDGHRSRAQYMRVNVRRSSKSMRYHRFHSLQGLPSQKGTIVCAYFHTSNDIPG